jgi:hypothetical protein
MVKMDTLLEAMHPSREAWVCSRKQRMYYAWFVIGGAQSGRIPTLIAP